MELHLSGKLKTATAEQPSFTGFRIEALFERTPAPAPRPSATYRPTAAELLDHATPTPIESDLESAADLIAAAPATTTAANAPIPFRVSALCDDAGNFTLALTDQQEIASKTVKFVVSSPAGLTVREVEFGVADLLTLVEITVSEFGPTILDKPVEPTEQPTRRVRGRVIERSGKQLPPSLQVLLLGHEQDTGDSDSLTPILVAKADSSGYFSGLVRNLKYDQLVAVVAGIPGDIPVKLVDSLVPPRIPIVVELPTTPAGPSSRDCNCSDGAVPRTPTQDDIAGSPGTFSADVGTGQCIRFNVPNRAIEEFNFYSVVRTTEPHIVGSTVGTLRDKTVPVRVVPTATESGALPPPAPAVSARTIEAGIREALLLVPRAPVGPGLPVPATWTALELLIRGAVIKAGGKPLSPTFFSQFPGWGAGFVWGFGGVLDSLNDGNAKLDTVIRQAGAAGATDADSTSGSAVRPPPGVPYFEADTTRIRDFSVARAASLYDRLSKPRPPGRVPLDGSAPVDWDYTPTFYQAASIAHGHLLHFKQVWYADGYSLGDLLYSLPLAPGQKKLISVVDWERREQATREEFTAAEEGLQAALSRDRDLSEVVSGTLSESARGGSRNTTAGVGAGKGSAGSGSYQGFNFGGVLGVSGGFGSSDATAFQVSSRDLSTTALQTLRDRTLQSASAVRNLRSTIVQTARQGEAVRATTEVVANHNHCHALTIQYFEVLRHFKVTHELADVQECLFVPFPMSEFDRPKVLRWREALPLYLKRRELAPAFDAARRIETDWSEEYTPVARYADELVSAIFGELTLTILIPLPPFPEKPKPKPGETIEETEAAVRKALVPTEGPLGVFLTIATLGANQLVSATADAVSSAAKATAQGAHALAESLLNEPSAEERYARFQQEVMPALAAGFVDQLELYALVGASEINASEIKLNGADFTLMSDYRPGTPLLVSVRGRITTPVARSSIAALVIKSSVPLPPGCRAIVNSASLRYDTKHFRHDMINDPRVNDDIDLPIVANSGTTTLLNHLPPGFGNLLLPNPPALPGFPPNWIQVPGMAPLRGGSGAMLYTPLDEWEQRSPRLEDIRLSAELVEHLNANLEYYHHAIWWTMDPNRRYMLLDGYQAPNAGGRSVASVVDNTLIGIVGNSLILPVAPGNRLDPEFSLKDGVTLLEYYDPQSPAPPSRVSLPTRGVFAEAVMGDCNACEEIDDTRFWRWEESPIDEPPALDMAALASRRSEPNYGTPTPFPTPIVNIQNAPQAPDPVGVAAALDTLAKQSFADITGLAGTQANAAAAYAKAMDTALAFGQEASKLAQQAVMTKNLAQTTRAIETAKQQGKISDEDEMRHTNNALDRLTMTPPPLVEAEMECSDPSEWEPWPGETKPKKPTKPGKPKGKTIPVEIALRVFVPAELWIPFAGSPIAFNGNNRGFGEAKTSRIEMGYTFELDTATFAVTKAVAKPVTFGVARVYNATHAVPVVDRPLWWMAKQNDAVAPLGQMGMEDAARRFEPEPLVRQNGFAVAFRMNDQPYFPWEGSAPKFFEHIPVVGGFVDAVAEAVTTIGNPNIDFDIMVAIARRYDGVPGVLVNGKHNMFPAYEVFVNGEEVYRWGEVKQFVGEPVLGLNREWPVIDPKPLRTMKVK